MNALIQSAPLHISDNAENEMLMTAAECRAVQGMGGQPVKNAPPSNFNQRKPMRLKHVLLFAATLALTACATTPPYVPSEKITKLLSLKLVPVSIECAAHSGVGYIHDFYVKEPFSSRMAGGLSCGGTVAAGYMLPKQWEPGMKVKVRWKPNGRDWIEKTTTIRQYERAGTLTVHFFKNDEVRVVSSPIYASGSPLHPILKDVVIAPPEEE
jgi:hypothetical protein